MAEGLPDDFPTRLLEVRTRSSMPMQRGDPLARNAAATRIFGYDEDEAIGQSLDLIIPERLRGQRHWEGWNRVLGGSPSRYPDGALLLAVSARRRSSARSSSPSSRQERRWQFLPGSPRSC